MAAHDYNWLWKQENQEFMVINGYTDWVSKKKTKHETMFQKTKESQKEKLTN